jgi:adenine-specific DNA-methyltransferase
MQQNLLNDLKDALEKDENLFIDGQLNKALIEQKALALDKDFLNQILDSDSLKKHFFEDIDGTLVFDKVKFQQFIHNKSFLPDSYTAFKNKIGLTSNGEYLSKSGEVVLAWPHKDCVLEGGQDKEDAKRDEIFWNETLAPDDIDRLLSPKVFTHWKKYDKDGEQEVEEPSLNNNYLIKGNNLLALHSLAEVYRGKVKLIYIDPPYNTGNDSFGYNDRFNHSSWLSFMRSRLEIAKELLSLDGSLWINIDDDEGHYLKVLADEVFGRENFVRNIVWQKKYSASNDSKGIPDMHDHILVYQRSSTFERNLLPRTEKQNKLYRHDDNDGRGRWRTDNLLVRSFSEKYVFPIKNPNTGEEFWPKEGSCWRANKETIEEWIKENRIFFGKDGTGAPQLKRYLSEVQQGIVPNSWWSFKDADFEVSEEDKKLNHTFYGLKK